MAILKPNSSYTVNGVKVSEKIIPDGARWKSDAKAVKAGFKAGTLYKKQQKLSSKTGKPKFVTIHNTADLKNVEDDGEQYTRATYNENMNSVRVHFYVDDIGAWQNLKAGTGMVKNDPENCAEVSWHAGDGSTADGGNMTSLSIEIIMNDNKEHDAKAKDNGARLAAWLLWKHCLPIDRLVTHTYWVNKVAGNKFSDTDKQCTNFVKGKKWCPSYIFNSSDSTKALANWKEFKKLVNSYLSTLNKSPTDVQTAGKTKSTSSSIVKKGDLVELNSNAVYINGDKVPNWIKKQNWYVIEVKGERAVIDKNESGTNAICSPINIKYLTVVKKSTEKDKTNNDTSYLVKTTTANLSIYKGPGTNYSKTGTIINKGVYTIVAESNGVGAEKWGKLKSGAGWVALDKTKKV